MKKMLLLSFWIFAAESAMANEDIRRGFDPRPHYQIHQSFKCKVGSNSDIFIAEVVTPMSEKLLILTFGAADTSGEIVYKKEMYDIQLASEAEQKYSISLTNESITLSCVQWSKPTH